MFLSLSIFDKRPFVDKPFVYKVADTARVELHQLCWLEFGGQERLGIVVDIHPQPEKDQEIKEVSEILPLQMPAYTVSLAHFMAWRYFCTTSQALHAMLPKEIREGHYFTRGEDIYTLQTQNDTHAKLWSKQNEVIAYLEAMPGCQASRADLSFASLQTLNSLIKKGILHKNFRRFIDGDVHAHGSGVHPYVPLDEIDLNTDQQTFVQHIWESDAPCHLLHGVTGSGKTEVFAKIIEKHIQNGQQALLLLPEIALTPQMLTRLQSRFGEHNIALMHSSMTDKQRADTTLLVAQNKVPIVIGSRSALFAPFAHLGCVVMDESHDESYVQDVNPRYHTLELASYLAQNFGVKLVCSTATPSVSQYLVSNKSPKWEYHYLSKRVHGGPLPHIDIIDMNLSKSPYPKTLFSKELIDGLSDTLGKGQQAIVFLNRRGYARHLVCQDCGHEVLCPNCDAGLVWHKFYPNSGGNIMLCHICGFKDKVSDTCRLCGSHDLSQRGYGTERLVSELSDIFPEARIARMDRETVTKETPYRYYYEQMQNKAIDIVVSTQMIAQGFDFPGVSFAGVLLADHGLYAADYKAEEKVFQTLVQVAGRAGRKETIGHICIQSFSPKHPVLNYVQQYDFNAFYTRELQSRKKYGYPPYGSVLDIELSGASSQKAFTQIDTFLQSVRQAANNDNISLTILGPMPHIPMKKLNRYHVHAYVFGKDFELTDLMHKLNTQEVKIKRI